MPRVEPLGDTVPYAVRSTVPLWPSKLQLQVSKASNDSEPLGRTVTTTSSPELPGGALGTTVADPLRPFPAKTTLSNSATRVSPDSVTLGVPSEIGVLAPTWVCVPE